MERLIVVDCEASGPCPGKGELTEFGAVHFVTRTTYHGVLFGRRPRADNSALPKIAGAGFDPVAVFTAFEEWLRATVPGQPVFVSDNPAFDIQRINHGFHHTLGRNPFGHSDRRTGDFYAGLTGRWDNTRRWKKLRSTPHDHHPLHDALGNAEALARILAGERS